jgi:hypothetical protein
MIQKTQSHPGGLVSIQSNPQGIYGGKRDTETGSFSEHFRIPSSRSFLTLSIHIFHTTVMEAAGA